MNPNVKCLKQCAAQACGNDHRARVALFSTFGLEDLLERADEEALSPKQIVAALLWECCCSDGVFNNCVAGIRTFQLYAKEALTPLSAVAFESLAKMLKAGTTKAAIDRWVESNFD